MARLFSIGTPCHQAEAEGIEFLRKALPKNFDLYANVHLPTGRRPAETYEHDVIVVCPHGVYAVELKAYRGQIRGNRDRWQLDDGKWVPSPITLNDDKARVLKSWIAGRRRDLRGLWVQAVVFVTVPGAQVHLTSDWQPFVKTRDGIAQALSDPHTYGMTFALSSKHRGWLRKLITDEGQDLPRQTVIGDYDLEQQLSAPAAAYTAWLSKNRANERHYVLRVYDLPTVSAAQADKVRARALREATVQEKLWGVPDVVRMHGFFTAADPPRVVLPFEDTSHLISLATWLQEFERAGITARVEIARRLTAALQAVHDAEVIHRRLSPDVVLVEPHPEPRELRLCAFDLSREFAATDATMTGSLLEDPAFRCIAPEVFRLGASTPRSDLFSLGAVLHELLTGQALFAKAEDVVGFARPGPMALQERSLPLELQQLVANLLAIEPQDRPADAAEALAVLEGLLPSATPRQPHAVDLEAGKVLRDLYELEAPIGQGATGPVWRVRQLQTGQALAMKVAPADRHETLDREADVLRAVIHPNIVRFASYEPLPDGRLMLLTGFADGVRLDEQAGAGDPLTPAQLRCFLEGLYAALGALHRANWLHRDVKPSNIVLDPDTMAPTLLDLGIATTIGTPGELTLGSVNYKDPALWKAEGWSVAQDLYAAALVCWELLTGLHPFPGGTPSTDQPPDLDPTALPDSFDAEAQAHLAQAVAKALSTDPAARPADAEQALAALMYALDGEPMSGAQVNIPVPIPAAPNAEIPADSEPSSPVSTLTLSKRATGALARLGIGQLSQLGGLERGHLKRLPNVGAKTIRELLAWGEKARQRWPQLHAAPPVNPGPAVFPPLVGDERPLTSLGRGLTKGVKRQLAELGIGTVGQLAALPLASLRALPGVGSTRIDKLREALGNLHAPQSFATLDALHRATATWLAVGEFEALAALCGLDDGQVRSASEAVERLGVTRQRVDQGAASAVERLRADDAPTVDFLQQCRELLGAEGFRSLNAMGQALGRRLPSDGSASVQGWARLAAVLLQPERRPSRLQDLALVTAPPWTPERIEQLAAALEQTCAHDLVGPAQAADALWSVLEPGERQYLEQRGVNERALLQALRPLAGSVLQEASGRLYVPPLPLDVGLRALRDALRPGWTRAELCEWLDQRLPGLTMPDEAEPLAEALRLVGLDLVDGVLRDPCAAEAPERSAPDPLDDDVRRVRVALASTTLPPGLQDLAVAAGAGGYRVVALDKAHHHQLAPLLARGLAGALGDERVRFVDVDRTLIQALKQAGLWDDALFFDGDAKASWGWARRELEAAMDRALQPAVPGTVTVLGRPALLGTLGLLPWLDALYDQARGGRFGLVVLAVPGGVHDGRVMLNGRQPMTCTPDMAPVYLEPEDVRSRNSVVETR